MKTSQFRLRTNGCLSQISQAHPICPRHAFAPVAIRPNPAKSRYKNKNYQTNPFVIFRFVCEYSGLSSSGNPRAKKRTHFPKSRSFTAPNPVLPLSSVSPCLCGKSKSQPIQPHSSLFHPVRGDIPAHQLETQTPKLVTLRLKPSHRCSTLMLVRAHGMWTYEPRQGRKAATVVCSTSAVVTLAFLFMMKPERITKKWRCPALK